MIQIMARPFSKPKFLGAPRILTLQAYISGVWCTIFKCKVCEANFKIDKFSCPFKEQ